MAKNPLILILFISISSLTFLPASLSQTPSEPVCNGILITYHYATGNIISPILAPSDPLNQPYRFESTLTVRNNGPTELKNWAVFVEFQHGELLVSSDSALLADGERLPANVSGGALFVGSSVADLKTAIETAGDDTETQVVVNLVGTEFGVASPDVPLPRNVSLANDGYSCLNFSARGNDTTTCCMPDPNARTSIITENPFSPLQTSDVSITYDVLTTYDTNYWARVTIASANPFARLQSWRLSWEWLGGEFINAMRGAYPETVDTNDCIFGEQGQFYKEPFDFSKSLSCARRPTILDLPLSMANDTSLGSVPFCCRDGTILPDWMDPARSKSSFQMQVYKMPPHLNKTELNPPANWMINSTAGPGYRCGQPIRVDPTHFPDPTGLPSNESAVATWQVACNITTDEPKTPQCCVSFSSYLNDSAVPCNTCACGCDANPRNGNDNICSASEQPLLIEPEQLLVPFDNRTKKALAFAELKGREIPSPLPCPDNCGVSINWHLMSDYKDGWTARITLFNWDGETSVADWFAAAELDRAMPGYEDVYSIEGRVLSGHDKTLFLKGLRGNNYLLAQRNGSDPRRDPPVPGTQQSVISFKKKETPGIKVSVRDGFPTKVYFNGGECSIPSIVPSGAWKVDGGISVLLVSFAVTVLIVMKEAID